MHTDIDVLLVEDNFSDAQMVEAIVGSSNLERPKLHHVGRFKEALVMLRKKDYDLVLLDLHLPDGQGIDLIKQLRQQTPKVPVVVITGVQDEEIAAAALREGAQDYVIKSDTFSPARLSRMGHTDLGNWLVRRIRHAIKRAELSTKVEEQNSSMPVRSVDQGTWEWDLAENLVYFSPRWQSMMGTQNQPIGNNPNDWLSRIHPEDRSRFDQTLQQYLDQQTSQFYCEHRIQHADRDYIWVLTKGVAVWNKTNVAFQIRGSQTDITVRKAQEQVSYQKREFAQTVLHSVGAGLLAVQATLHIQAGRYEEAEPFLQNALALRKSLLGKDHPDVAISLYNLAALYDNQFRFKEAESLFKQSLSLFKKTLGVEHPQTQQVQIKVNMICRLNQAMKVIKNHE
ncbi:MAG: tetratricopeptide repeat protein [Cyanobacteria bacterium J06621_11]